MPIPRLILCLLLCAPFLTQAQADDLGSLSANPFDFNPTAYPFGQGSAFAPNGVNNPFSPYCSPFSNQSATNPFATDALNAEPSFRRYGSRFSPDSPKNPYGQGWKIGGVGNR
jgi:hypothetical protein